VQIFTSVLVGLATGLVFAAIGLERAAVWGVAAAVLNLVPYIGSLAITAGAALVGFVQFGAPGPALLLGGASLAIHTLSGNLLTPWLTSRASRMSPVVIFVGVLAWGWLWGLWGLLLGAPLLMAIKAVCDHVDDLKPVGELLGT
jgi:predicted PurR-regulated permease PerM